MREPAFWWRNAGRAAALLAAASAVYGALAVRRMLKTGRHAGIPVLCIGNFTLGGAGKTPTALALAGMLLEEGERPYFLSRGYGGRLSGPIQVNLTEHRAPDIGDEPLLLARRAPTIVSHDRVAGAQAARAAGATVVVMDDGFQNPTLHKDVSLVVVDTRRGIGNRRVFPGGPLRAPLERQLARTSAILLVGEGDAGDDVVEAARARDIPVFRAAFVPDSNAVASFSGQRVLAFAGIGDPQKFFATLQEAGIDAPVTQAFPDHYRYTPADCAVLLRRAEQEGLALLTTEKDLVRLAGDEKLAALAARVRALPVTLVLDDPAALRDWLLPLLRGARDDQSLD
jgi:tetraacyldisaccharide 4'-kinase